MIEALGGTYDPALPPVRVSERERSSPLGALPVILIIGMLLLNRVLGGGRSGAGDGRRGHLRPGDPARRLRRRPALGRRLRRRRLQRRRRELRRRRRLGALVTMAFLTDQDRTRIAAAIAAAERRTSGELVAVVAEAADDYRYIALLWPALAALLLPALLLTAVRRRLDARLLYLAQTAAFALLVLLAQLRPVRLALVPAATKRRRAGRLAREQFIAQGLHLTAGPHRRPDLRRGRRALRRDHRGPRHRRGGAARHLGRGGRGVRRAGARRARQTLCSQP